MNLRERQVMKWGRPKKSRQKHRWCRGIFWMTREHFRPNSNLPKCMSKNWQKLINLLQTKLDKMLNFQWQLAISTNCCVVEMLSTVPLCHGVRVSLSLIIIIGRKKYGCLLGWAGCDSQPVLCLQTVLSDHQLVILLVSNNYINCCQLSIKTAMMFHLVKCEINSGS